MYSEYFKWALAVGKSILTKEKGEDLLRRLIFEIRAEETPGRFLDKLSENIGEYNTNRNILLNATINKDIYDKVWFADNFYYLKSAILSGFINALATKSNNKGDNNE